MKTDKQEIKKVNEWKYIKNNITEAEVKAVEKLFGFELLKEHAEFILNHNNGRPKINSFDTENFKEQVFEKILSFNKDDRDNVYKTNEALRNRLPVSLFAVVADPFGNYICIDKEGMTYFWLHETSKIENINKSLINLIEDLY